MEISNAMMVDIQIVAGDVPTTGTLEERLLVTMKAVRSGKTGMMFARNWDEEFRTAIGAVWLKATPEEQERLKEELQALANVSALFEGIPLDVTRLELPKKPIKLLDIWHKAKGE